MAAKSDAKRLDELRDQVARLKGEAQELNQRPVDEATALAGLDRWIEQQAASFQPTITNLVNSGEAWTQLHEVRTGGTWDFTAALCALCGDQIRQYFAERIRTELAARSPMAPDEVENRKREVDQERLELEREEEQIVRRMQAAGQEVQRRPDVDPRALLGLDRAPERPAPPAEAADKPKVAHGPAKFPHGEKL